MLEITWNIRAGAGGVVNCAYYSGLGVVLLGGNAMDYVKIYGSEEKASDVADELGELEWKLLEILGNARAGTGSAICDVVSSAYPSGIGDIMKLGKNGKKIVGELTEKEWRLLWFALEVTVEEMFEE